MKLQTLAYPEKGAKKPVFHLIKKTENYKVFSISFEEGAFLKNHRAPVPATLTCLKGKVAYITEKGKKILLKNEQVDISPSEIHAVKALESSTCLLILDFHNL